MNEAEEVFILVLEIDNEDIDFAFDEEGGVLVYTILDDNREPIIREINFFKYYVLSLYSDFSKLCYAEYSTTLH